MVNIIISLMFSVIVIKNDILSQFQVAGPCGLTRSIFQRKQINISSLLFPSNCISTLFLACFILSMECQFETNYNNIHLLSPVNCAIVSSKHSSSPYQNQSSTFFMLQFLHSQLTHTPLFHIEISISLSVSFCALGKILMSFSNF